MKLSIRFILPLAIILGLIAYSVVPVVENLTLEWFKRDLDLRATLISRTLQVPLTEIFANDSDLNSKVEMVFEDLTKDERLVAIGFCDNKNTLSYKTKYFPKEINCNLDPSSEMVVDLKAGPAFISIKEFSALPPAMGKIIIVHDLSFVVRRSESTRKYILFFFLVLIFVVSGVTVVVAQLSWRGWVASLRSFIKGDGVFSLHAQDPDRELRPIAKDLRILVRELERDRKIRDPQQLTWNPAALKEILERELSGDEILILSNREPYIHQKVGDKIELQVPASGLVTALEPIMRACSGTWVAHGNGSADKEMVDEFDRVSVPPENPCYRIRRVWLSKEEEEGYYYGLSNGGLWPLCHIAHTRPTFRTEDWEQYKAVNEKFCEAVVSEARTENPVILIQDYHFALAPRMIRKKLPRATIITFWHIPWPNAESFGICPWREEIIEGLLGSSILGFHTRFHCNNFLAAADRYLECRIDRDTSIVSFQKEFTAINAYPISIEWPPQGLEDVPSRLGCTDHVRSLNQIAVKTRIGIGVDRMDYTKGILERFMAVERLFELYPQFIGNFSFVQIAAPTRSAIKQYQHFSSDVRDLADKINSKYGNANYCPIILLAKHHAPKEIFEYFRASDICFVSSLHDGMNLVAKEFIAARNDEEGVLILSQFTGAAKELPEALIVNPYNIDQCAHALAIGLMMPIKEQKERMRNMRAHVEEYNVFRWAGRMLIDAAKMRQRNRIEAGFTQS